MPTKIKGYYGYLEGDEKNQVAREYFDFNLDGDEKDEYAFRVLNGENCTEEEIEKIMNDTKDTKITIKL